MLNHWNNYINLTCSNFLILINLWKIFIRGPADVICSKETWYLGECVENIFFHSSQKISSNNSFP